MIAFEEAINVKKKSLTEEELLNLNKIREYSLFKFYNTSLKTPYSFICQNVLPSLFSFLVSEIFIFIETNLVNTTIKTYSKKWRKLVDNLLKYQKAFKNSIFVITANCCILKISSQNASIAQIKWVYLFSQLHTAILI